MKKILPALAIILAIAAVVFVMIVQKKLKEEEAENEPQQSVNTGTVTPSGQTAETVTRPPVKLGNDDDGIAYEGPGTVRDEGMAKPGDANYRLGNQDGAIGLEPIAEYETLTEYSTRMFGGEIPNSLTVSAKGTDTAAALASFDDSNAHLKHTSPDGSIAERYMIKGVLYAGSGTEWEKEETSPSLATGKEFAKQLMDLFSSPNVTGFTHRIDTLEKSEHPIEGETVLNFRMDMEKAAGLMESLCVMTGGEYASLSGTLDMEMRLDRWGIVETVTITAGTMNIGEGTYDAKGYVIRFSDIDCSGPIYLPGTEPTPTPTAEPEPVQGGGGSGGETPAHEGKQKGDTDKKGDPIQTTGKVYIYPSCELDDKHNTFELADGLTVTYAGSNDDEEGEDYGSYFVVRNSSKENYTVGVYEMGFNTDNFSESAGSVSSNALNIAAGKEVTLFVKIIGIRRWTTFTSPERTGYLFKAEMTSGLKVTNQRIAYYNHKEDTKIQESPEATSVLPISLLDQGTYQYMTVGIFLDKNIRLSVAQPVYYSQEKTAGLTVKICSVLKDEKSFARKFRITGLDIIEEADKETKTGNVVAKCTIADNDNTGASAAGLAVLPGTGTYYTAVMPESACRGMSDTLTAMTTLQGMDILVATVEEYDYISGQIIEVHELRIPTPKFYTKMMG